MNKLEYIYNTSISKIVELTHNRGLFEKFLQLPEDGPSPSQRFIRDTPLSLSRLLAFMIMPRAASFQSELERFFSGIGYPIPSKSAFSMKRKLISPGIFQYLNRELLDDYYHSSKVKKWKGKYIIAVDGTTLTMPVGSRFEPLYGSAPLTQDQSKRVPTARAVVLMDVLNNQILDIELDKYTSHEPETAYSTIISLPQFILDNSIFIFDRLYLSSWLLTALQNANIQYIMRCRQNFSPAIDSFFQSKRRYADVKIAPSSAVWTNKTSKRFERMGITPEQHRPLFIHLTKSSLPGGYPEVICSHTPGIRLSAAQAYELYGRRWKVETAIGMEKNEWQIEIFSGYTKTAILQDVYCKMLSYNLCSMATALANKKLQRQFSRKTNKACKDKPGSCGRHYHVDVNMALFNFKRFIVQVVKGRNKLHALILRYIEEVSQYYEPYRPGEAYPRNFCIHKASGKYATYSNYARVL